MIVQQPVHRAVFHPDKMGKSDLVKMEKLFVGLNAFEVGHEHKAHIHESQDKLYLVVEGEGDVTVEGKTTRICKGDLVAMRAGEEHALVNSGPARLIVMVVMAPPPGVAKPCQSD